MTLTFNEQEYNGQGYDRSNDPFKLGEAIIQT